MDDLKIVKMVINKEYSSMKDHFNKMIAEKIADRIQMKKQAFLKTIREG
jgi:hypothetical protein